VVVSSMRGSASSFLRWGLVLLIAAAGAVAASHGRGKTLVAGSVAWEHDLDAASARAKAQNKPLLVMFGADWDCAAKELQHETFSDPLIRLWLAAGFVSAYVDMTDEDLPSLKASLERFKVVGDPALIVIARDGTTELTRLNEFVPPAELLPSLRAALSRDPQAASAAVNEARAERQQVQWAKWKAESDAYDERATEK
jgi:thiol:disulfide interchange protein